MGLENVPIFLTTSKCGSTSQTVCATATNNRINLKVNQFTGYFTFGLTSSVDISVAVPILSVQEQITTAGIEYELNPPFASAPVQSYSNAGSRVENRDRRHKSSRKSQALEAGDTGTFAGAEVRLPTGDSLNFLGAGTVGVRPFAVFTYGGRISPHLNIAYEANGSTNLVTNTYGNAQLPNRLIYSAGADWRVTSWLTLAADILEQRVFNAQQMRLKPGGFTIPNPSLSYPSIEVYTGSYNRTDGSIGFKLKPYKTIILTANLAMKLDQGCLRARNVPLGGVSITF